MAGVGTGKESATTIRVVTRDEEGHKRVEKAELPIHNPDTVSFIERKLHKKGIQRMERHPADGLSLAHGPPKLGHGGKFTWEGPGDPAENQLYAPPAIDEKDPNYVDEEEINIGSEEKDGEVERVIVGEVEVAKAVEAKEGVSRIEVLPPLQP